MVYKITKNEDGDYIKDGVRYDLLSCNVCESIEYDEEGNPTVVINKGWTEYASDEAAIAGFGLTYDPKQPEA